MAFPHGFSLSCYGKTNSSDDCVRGVVVSPRQLFRHHLGCRQLRTVQHIGVDIRRSGDGAVTQHGGDDFQVHAARQHEGGVGVAQTVERDVLKAGARDKRLELPLRVIVVHVAAARGGEDHFRMGEGAAGGARGSQAGPLLPALAEEQAFDFAAHRQLTNTAASLRRGQPVVGRHVGEVLPDVDDLVVKVHVLPAQAESLAGPHAGEEEEPDDGVEPRPVFGHGVKFPRLRFGQVRAEFFGRRGFAWQDDVVAGVAIDEPVLHRNRKHATQADEDDAGIGGRDRQAAEEFGEQHVVEVREWDVPQSRQQKALRGVTVVVDGGILQGIRGVVGEVPF